MALFTITQTGAFQEGTGIRFTIAWTADTAATADSVFTFSIARNGLNPIEQSGEYSSFAATSLPAGVTLTDGVLTVTMAGLASAGSAVVDLAITDDGNTEPSESFTLGLSVAGAGHTLAIGSAQAGAASVNVAGTAYEQAFTSTDENTRVAIPSDAMAEATPGMAQANFVTLGSTQNQVLDAGAGDDIYVLTKWQTGNVRIDDATADTAAGATGTNILILDRGVNIATIDTDSITLQNGAVITIANPNMFSVSYGGQAGVAGTLSALSWSDFMTADPTGEVEYNIDYADVVSDVSTLLPTRDATTGAAINAGVVSTNREEIFVAGSETSVELYGLRGDDTYVITRHQRGDMFIFDGRGENLIRFDDAVALTNTTTATNLYGATFTLATGSVVTLFNRHDFNYQLGDGNVLTYAELVAIIGTAAYTVEPNFDPKLVTITETTAGATIAEADGNTDASTTTSGVVSITSITGAVADTVPVGYLNSSNTDVVLVTATPTMVSGTYGEFTLEYDDTADTVTWDYALDDTSTATDMLGGVNGDGSESLTFYAGTGTERVEQVIMFDITGFNEFPVSSANPATLVVGATSMLAEDISGGFSLSALETAIAAIYSDVEDSDTGGRIKIVSYTDPDASNAASTKGRIHLATDLDLDTPVAADQLLAIADLGDYVFVPEENFNGNVTLSFNLVDTSGQESTDIFTHLFTVTPVTDDVVITATSPGLAQADQAADSVTDYSTITIVDPDTDPAVAGTYNFAVTAMLNPVGAASSAITGFSIRQNANNSYQLIFTQPSAGTASVELGTGGDEIVITITTTLAADSTATGMKGVQVLTFTRSDLTLTSSGPATESGAAVLAENADGSAAGTTDDVALGVLASSGGETIGFSSSRGGSNEFFRLDTTDNMLYFIGPATQSDFETTPSHEIIVEVGAEKSERSFIVGLIDDNDEVGTTTLKGTAGSPVADISVMENGGTDQTVTPVDRIITAADIETFADFSSREFIEDNDAVDDWTSIVVSAPSAADTAGGFMYRNGSGAAFSALAVDDMVSRQDLLDGNLIFRPTADGTGSHNFTFNYVSEAGTATPPAGGLPVFKLAVVEVNDPIMATDSTMSPTSGGAKFYATEGQTEIFLDGNAAQIMLHNYFTDTETGATGVFAGAGFAPIVGGDAVPTWLGVSLGAETAGGQLATLQANTGGAGAPAAGATQEITINFRVRDDGGATADIPIMLVIRANTAPTVSMPTDVIVTDAGALSVAAEGTIAFSDDDGTSVSGVHNGYANQMNEMLTITADGVAVSTSATTTVDDVVMVDDGSGGMMEVIRGTFSISRSGGDITWSYALNTDNLAASGVEGLAAATTVKSSVVEIVVDDGVDSVAREISVTITGRDDGPAFADTSPEIRTMFVPVNLIGEVIFANYDAIDPDGDAVTYSLSTGDTEFNISAAGALSWDNTATVVDGMTYTATVDATDGTTPISAEALVVTGAQIQITPAGAGGTAAISGALTIAETAPGADGLTNRMVGDITNTATGTYTYALAVDTATIDNELFLINGDVTNGFSLVVHPNQALDFETKPSYTIHVQVLSDTSAFLYTESYMLTVTDVEEDATGLTLSATTGSTNEIAASVAVPSLATITIIDPDASVTTSVPEIVSVTRTLVNGTTLAVTLNSADNPFALDATGTTLSLKAGVVLDRAIATAYNVVIRVDNDINTDTTYTYTINDINDAPMRSTVDLPSSQTFTEGTGAMANILDVSTLFTDPDTLDGGTDSNFVTLTYSYTATRDGTALTSAEMSTITIDAATGMLSVTDAITAGTYVFAFTATDAGSPALSVLITDAFTLGVNDATAPMITGIDADGYSSVEADTNVTTEGMFSITGTATSVSIGSTAIGALTTPVYILGTYGVLEVTLTSSDATNREYSWEYTAARETNDGVGGTTDDLARYNALKGLNGADEDNFALTAVNGSATGVDFINIDITALNDAPTTSAGTATLNEGDTARAFMLTDFNFTDLDAAHTALSAIAISNITGGGEFRLNGAVISGNKTITAAQISAGDFVFEATDDYTGTTTFMFRVQDGDGAQSAPATFTFTGTATDDAPISTTAVNNVITAADAVEEDAAPFNINLITDLGFFDADGDAITGFTVTALPTLAGGVASAGVLSYMGTDIAADARVVYTAGMDDLLFTPVANFNGMATFTFTFDSTPAGTAVASDVITYNINFTPVADAPVLNEATGGVKASGFLISGEAATVTAATATDDAIIVLTTYDDNSTPLDTSDDQFVGPVIVEDDGAFDIMIPDNLFIDPDNATTPPTYSIAIKGVGTNLAIDDLSYVTYDAGSNTLTIDATRDAHIRQLTNTTSGDVAADALARFVITATGVSDSTTSVELHVGAQVADDSGIDTTADDITDGTASLSATVAEPVDAEGVAAVVFTDTEIEATYLDDDISDVFGGIIITAVSGVSAGSGFGTLSWGTEADGTLMTLDLSSTDLSTHSAYDMSISGISIASTVLSSSGGLLYTPTDNDAGDGDPATPDIEITYSVYIGTDTAITSSDNTMAIEVTPGNDAPELDIADDAELTIADFASNPYLTFTVNDPEDSANSMTFNAADFTLSGTNVSDNFEVVADPDGMAGRFRLSLRSNLLQSQVLNATTIMLLVTDSDGATSTASVEVRGNTYFGTSAADNIPMTALPASTAVQVYGGSNSDTITLRADLADKAVYRVDSSATNWIGTDNDGTDTVSGFVAGTHEIVLVDNNSTASDLAALITAIDDGTNSITLNGTGLTRTATADTAADVASASILSLQSELANITIQLDELTLGFETGSSIAINFAGDVAARSVTFATVLHSTSVVGSQASLPNIPETSRVGSLVNQWFGDGTQATRAVDLAILAEAALPSAIRVDAGAGNDIYLVPQAHVFSASATELRNELDFHATITDTAILENAVDASRNIFRIDHGARLTNFVDIEKTTGSLSVRDFQFSFKSLDTDISSNRVITVENADSGNFYFQFGYNGELLTANRAKALLDFILGEGVTETPISMVGGIDATDPTMQTRMAGTVTGATSLFGFDQQSLITVADHDSSDTTNDAVLFTGPANEGATGQARILVIDVQASVRTTQGFTVDATVVTSTVPPTDGATPDPFLSTNVDAARPTIASFNALLVGSVEVAEVPAGSGGANTDVVPAIAAVAAATIDDRIIINGKYGESNNLNLSAADIMVGTSTVITTPHAGRDYIDLSAGVVNRDSTGTDASARATDTLHLGADGGNDVVVFHVETPVSGGAWEVRSDTTIVKGFNLADGTDQDTLLLIDERVGAGTDAVDMPRLNELIASNQATLKTELTSTGNVEITAILFDFDGLGGTDLTLELLTPVSFDNVIDIV